MKPQKNIIEETRFDPGVASRYRMFRMKYVDESMTVAADLLGISQGSISFIESAKRGVGSRATKVMLEKYNLNINWLTTGKGLDRIEKPVHETQMGKTITDLRSKVIELEAKIAGMDKQMKVMHANHTHFMNRIEKFLEQQESH